MDEKIITLIDGPRKGMVIKCSAKLQELKLVVIRGGVFCDAIYKETTRGKFKLAAIKPKRT